MTAGAITVESANDDDERARVFGGECRAAAAAAGADAAVPMAAVVVASAKASAAAVALEALVAF